LEIREAIDQGDLHVKGAIYRYRRAGQLLTIAQEKVGHGNWKKWCSKNKIHERRARRYMALARADVTSDLEAQWRIISGNASAEDAAENTDESTPSASNDPESPPIQSPAQDDTPEAEPQPEHAITTPRLLRASNPRSASRKRFLIEFSDDEIESIEANNPGITSAPPRDFGRWLFDRLGPTLEK
jgi:hypothetical protein